PAAIPPSVRRISRGSGTDPAIATQPQDQALGRARRSCQTDGPAASGGSWHAEPPAESARAIAPGQRREHEPVIVRVLRARVGVAKVGAFNAVFRRQLALL